MTRCPSPQLYESALTENQKLKTKLQEAQLQLADVKARLEQVTQVRAGWGQGERGAEETGDRSWEQVSSGRDHSFSDLTEFRSEQRLTEAGSCSPRRQSWWPQC